jgi:signal peptidase
MYLLIMSLWTSIIPIIPNPNEYIYAVIEFVTPFIYLFFLNNYLKKDNDEEVSRKKHRKSFGVLIGPALLVIILVYFTSGLFHYHAIAIASGSMTPKILKGDVVVVEKVEPNTLEVGQVIAYRRDNSIIVHRLIKILTVGDEIFYYTQGDANDFVDNCKITKDMIIGVVDLRIPFIGYPTVWLNNL